MWMVSEIFTHNNPTNNCWNQIWTSSSCKNSCQQWCFTIASIILCDVEVDIIFIHLTVGEKLIIDDLRRLRLKMEISVWKPPGPGLDRRSKNFKIWSLSVQYLAIPISSIQIEKSQWYQRLTWNRHYSVILPKLVSFQHFVRTEPLYLYLENIKYKPSKMEIV